MHVVIVVVYVLYRMYFTVSVLVLYFACSELKTETYHMELIMCLPIMLNIKNSLLL